MTVHMAAWHVATALAAAPYSSSRLRSVRLSVPCLSEIGVGITLDGTMPGIPFMT